METSNKIQYLIVDTSAFIKNAALQDIGVNIITDQDVVNEITNKRQLRRLVVLPYDLNVQSAFPENIKFVTEFAKKTGDYTSLSATDIKVIALTYQLEKEKVGTEHLKEAPIIVKTVNSAKRNKNRLKPVVGFYMPKKKLNRTNGIKDKENITQNEEEEVYVDSLQEYLDPIDDDIVNDVDKQKDKENPENEKNDINEEHQKYEKEAEEEENEDDEKDEIKSDATESSNECGSDYETATSDIDYDTDIETEDLADKFSNLNCEPDQLEIQSEDGKMHNVDDILAPISDEEDKDLLEQISECEDEFEDECNNDSDWITPSNIKNMKKHMDSDILKEKSATVACLTMDFAMQNVLMQIGLNIASLDGRVIKQMRTFIFRCYACFKTTSIMTKVFCPNCGNKTLKKVAISLDDNGKQQIHINARRPLSAKGKKFSLPTPKGGKHANNPILCEDQPLPQQRVSKLARTKNDPLYEDYIAGFSPFVTRDVYSKSAMLGIRSNGAVKYWMKRNPNESRRKQK
ncbi:RNA-binding protein NOB1-like [Vespa mandarinia]|uniref:RNA-binding protein NOB1-like n=1 Tax=Vespa mandarinia TaxID=7446 RepID=UPI001619E4FF|nr:RNA-binding protein NOB1-like [Vespa mandarinia]